MGSGPLDRVPGKALRTVSLEAWARARLADAAQELDDLRGELLFECHEVPAPGPGARPVFACRVQLGPGGR
ncbi:hypothetical protein TR51_18340 [Kitasatospora griseola]|uniref:Uncharacterized protein n=1 Tax=Kitasatospora griseola TaxID=2064 RepID=A0A0D0PT88_KITGR|nr:hypothetical protein TR51_18340 [Kitasatospora griseola]